VQVVLDKNKPKIRTVVNKTDAIQNDYRTMQLEILAGHDSLVTTVIESGLRFKVDLATVYALILTCLVFFSDNISDFCHHKVTRDFQC
jgi:tRNA (guanine37-N1)-methyltransferase